jgi:predicted nucleic acid-binding protein
MTVVESFFVDSNLLLYYVDPQNLQKQARAMECSIIFGSLEPAAARQIVEDLAHWKPVDTSIGLIQQAWHWMDSAQIPYWDALIVAAAQRSGARYLLSEDFEPGREYEGVRIENPFTHSASDFMSAPPV